MFEDMKELETEGVFPENEGEEQQELPLPITANNLSNFLELADTLNSITVNLDTTTDQSLVPP